jgi:hypothetical protein
VTTHQTTINPKALSLGTVLLTVDLSLVAYRLYY